MVVFGRTDRQIHAWEGSIEDFNKLNLGDYYVHNYILCDSGSSGVAKIYIGETGNRMVRIRQSLKRFSECLSPRIFLLFSSVENCHKFWRTFIEGRLYFALSRHPYIELLNHPQMVSAAQRGLSKDCLSYAEQGINLALEYLANWGVELQRAAPHEHLVCEMSIVHHGKHLYADGFEDNGKWVVMAGSCARHLPPGPHDDGRRLREELIGTGTLCADSSGLYRFLYDVAFSSPSAAAGVINGKMASGPNRWVVRGRGTPLKELAIRFSGRRGCAASFDI